MQLLFIAVVVGGAYLYAPPIGAVTSQTLQHSLAREVGGTTGSTTRNCFRRSEGVWVCGVDGKGANNVEYLLTRHGRRCWDATQVHPGRGRLPVSASACAGMRDQFRF
ncbi:MAG: hypothetical protein QOJ29_1591 [Thermoleophilaceae bacterium]|nr:hypothetical protein [Thermoleophilaceae bacterium]